MLICTRENELLVKKYNKVKNKGIKKNSTLRFLYKVLEASNLVMSKWDMHEKIEHIEKIFVNINIVSL